ncbi:MAG: glycosyltransferase family 2 protein [Verrucomicrobia bacterium]|nr:glycosyltransferase family 2 protein [Verrucomicrobiota bacterium]
MNWAAECVVVIPCLNEAGAIESLVATVRRSLPNVIVVDDGSSDPTADLAERAGAQVIRLPGTSGKGAALNAGWRRAFERGFKWALTMDGDGQHSPDDIPGMLALAEKENAALVVGNRMNNPLHMPWLRRQVNRWMSRRLSRMAGQPLPDTQCGFRLMRLDVWSTLQLDTTHFEIESEILLAFAAAGHRVHFIPIKVIYQDEKSKIRPLQDTRRWFRWWWRMRRNASELKSGN